jgi:replicative DNA helicase
MTDAGLIPPHDTDAEAVLLAAVLVEERFDELAHVVRREHFYADCNATIWGAIVELQGIGKPSDLTTVAGWLRDRNRLAQVGGTPYLATLTSAPSVAKLEPYAERVVDKARLRAIIQEARTIVADAYNGPEDVGVFVQGAEARIYACAGEATRAPRAQTAKEVMKFCVPEIARRFNKEAPDGHRTGFPSLDLRIGGLRRGRVYVVAARPGMGKTALMTQVVKSVATSESEDRGVFLASLEMPREQIGERFLAQEAALDTRKVELGWLTRSEWDKICASGAGIGAWPMVIDDEAGMTVSALRSSLRRAARRIGSEYGVRMGLVCIDYFQLISTADQRWGGSTNDQLEKISAGIAGLAKEFDVPVMLLSQLNRECEKRPGKRPQMSDLRGSGALEQDAHTIMFLFREDLYRDRKDHDRSAEIIIAKARGGRCGTVRLSYVDWCTKFGDDQANDEDDELAHYRREAEELSVDFEDMSDMRHP